MSEETIPEESIEPSSDFGDSNIEDSVGGLEEELSPESSEAIEDEETLRNGESSEGDLENFADEIEEKIDQESIIAKGAGKVYKDSLNEEAERLGMSPEKIDDIDQRIEQERKAAQEDIEKIKSTREEDTKNIAKNGRDEEDKILEETIGETENLKDEVQEWAQENLDPKTQEFLEQNGYDELNQELTPEQQVEFVEKLNQVLDRMSSIDRSSGLSALRMLDKLPEEEQDKLKEFIKLMLRLAVKTTAKVVSTVAKNIAKSAGEDDKALKAICGTVADLTDSGAKYFDKFISGKKEGDLALDTRKFLFG